MRKSRMISPDEARRVKKALRRAPGGDFLFGVGKLSKKDVSVILKKIDMHIFEASRLVTVLRFMEKS